MDTRDDPTRKGSGQYAGMLQRTEAYIPMKILEGRFVV